MDIVSIFRHEGPTPVDIKGKGISSTRITNKLFERCHSIRKRQREKRLYKDNN